MWQNYEKGKKRESVIFLKYYNKMPVVLNIEATKNGLIAQTIFLDDKGAYEATKKRRKGFLIKKT
ncbi:MAG: hypothetical protein Fur0027_07150 [Raineya sp.]